MVSEIRIVLTGGGTGGHVFPLLAVAKELRELAAAQRIVLGLYYVGPMRGPFVIDEALFREHGIIIREVFAASGIRGVLAVLAGFFQSMWFLYRIMPDVILSKGGYGAIPVIAAGIFYRIPFVIHESDAVPGKVNEASGRFAARIGISFEGSARYFPARKTALVGNPVRRDLIPLPDRESAIRHFAFDPQRKTILVMGGSQGAKTINDLALDILPDLVSTYQVIHQCGPRHFESIREEARFVVEKMLGGEADAYYRPYGFLLFHDLRAAYAASDIVVSRAGSGSIFELALAGKPSILVPFRWASRDHQRENAYAYAARGAATVLEEENLTHHILLRQFTELIGDEARLRTMASAARAFAKPDAAAGIARELLKISRVRV